MRKLLFMSITVLLLGGCSGSDTSNSSPNTSLDTDSRLTRASVMAGLQNPWDMAFAPDGTLFFTEKCRGLSVRKTDGTIVRLFGTEGSAVIPGDFFCEGQSGMLGVAVHPAFENNRTIYLYMLSNFNAKANMVVRLKVDANYTTVTDRVDIVTGIPYKRTGNAWGPAGSNSGGRLRFGPDGYLYITTGDNQNGALPQDLTSLGGKVLRVTEDGKAVPENNPPAGADARIFTYGHRDVQGITFHPDTGQPFVCEAGPKTNDEVTGLIPGKNAGWDPKPDAGVTCVDNYCGDVPNRINGPATPMTDLIKFPDALKPVVSYGDSPGMGPCTFLKGDQWKGWKNNMVVGMLSGERLDILHFNGEGGVDETIKILLPSARMRAVVQGPDEQLYIATDGGEVWVVGPR